MLIYGRPPFLTGRLLTDYLQNKTSYFPVDQLGEVIPFLGLLESDPNAAIALGSL
jgi:hypothetical protein